VRASCKPHGPLLAWRYRMQLGATERSLALQDAAWRYRTQLGATERSPCSSKRRCSCPAGPLPLQGKRAPWWWRCLRAVSRLRQAAPVAHTPNAPEHVRQVHQQLGHGQANSRVLRRGELLHQLVHPDGGGQVRPQAG